MPVKPTDYARIATGYDRWAATYDQMPNAMIAADEQAFPPIWRHIRGLRVLEIGCGTGRQTRRLVAQGNQITALDVSAGMLAVARAVPALRDVTFVESDILLYEPIQGEGFDVVIASLVLEHVASLPAFFAKISTLLRLGGVGFFCEIHPDRTRNGSGAHFIDEDGHEVRLGTIAHTERDFALAIAEAGLTFVHKDDFFGTIALAQRRAEWKKYLGLPLLQIWQIRR